GPGALDVRARRVGLVAPVERGPDVVIHAAGGAVALEDRRRHRLAVEGGEVRVVLARVARARPDVPGVVARDLGLEEDRAVGARARVVDDRDLALAQHAHAQRPCSAQGGLGRDQLDLVDLRARLAHARGGAGGSRAGLARVLAGGHALAHGQLHAGLAPLYCAWGLLHGSLSLYHVCFFAPGFVVVLAAAVRVRPLGRVVRRGIGRIAGRARDVPGPHARVHRGHGRRCEIGRGTGSSAGPRVLAVALGLVHAAA